MNKEFVKTATRAAHRVGFKIKKHSPTILVVGGVVGVVASTVMACKATTKLSEVLEDHKYQREQVEEYVETNGYSEEYTEEDKKKDLTIIYTQSAVKLVKLYGPSVLLGVASITAIVSSHHILSKRNVALAAAYTTIDKSFKEYRGRVVEKFGKEVDRELRHNIVSKEIEETVADEDGVESTVTKTVDVASPDVSSDYARFYDDGCTGWTKDSEANLMFLRGVERWANEKLQNKGHLFLNEVYEALGIPLTKAGYVVGWIYDEKNPVGDNYVDFGIYDIHSEKKRDFVNGYERVILLDFNVDGNIIDML